MAVFVSEQNDGPHVLSFPFWISRFVVGEKILFRSINTEILQWQVVSFSGHYYGSMLVSSFHEPEPLLRPLLLVFMELFDFISDLLNEK